MVETPIRDGFIYSNLNIFTVFPQVLCFDSYFQQAVHERRDEQYRVRKCQILFYLEDDTVQVIEPRVKNSALPQGKFLHY